MTQGKRALAAGQYAQAVQLLQTAYDQSPSCDVTFYLGMARYRLSEWDRAIVELKSASECDPRNAGALVALGASYAAKHDDNRALAALES
ncbi:MAG: tetratricopeptide repeat protein, partial [Bryobacteraceae bacterium]